MLPATVAMMGEDFDRYFRRRWREERPARWPGILAVVIVGLVILPIEIALGVHGLVPAIVQVAIELPIGVWVVRRQWRGFDARQIGRTISDEWVNARRKAAPWN